MGHALWPLLLIIGSNLVYQSCSKSSAPGANPWAALTIVYIIATLASFSVFLLTGRGASFVENVKAMNLANYLMGVAIIGLEGGFLYLYRTGWSISVGPIMTYTGVALGLLLVGMFFYGEHITLRQVLGTLLCLGGIALVSLK